MKSVSQVGIAGFELLAIVRISERMASDVSAASPEAAGAEVSTLVQTYGLAARIAKKRTRMVVIVIVVIVGFSSSFCCGVCFKGRIH